MKQTATAVLVVLAAASLGACSTNTKGSWACPAEKGMPCASIETLDATATPHDRGGLAAAPRDDTPLPGGAPARWWAANDVVGSHFVAQPRREPDQTVKVLVAGWVDDAGDYHAPSEIYAVMRRGGWWTAPNVVPLMPTQRPREAQAAVIREQTPPSAPARPASLDVAPTTLGSGVGVATLGDAPETSTAGKAGAQLPGPSVRPAPALTQGAVVGQSPRTDSSARPAPAPQPVAHPLAAASPAAGSPSTAAAPKPVATNATAPSAAAQTNSKS